MKNIKDKVLRKYKNRFTPDFIKFLSEFIDQALTARDEEWREKIENFKLMIAERRMAHHKDCLTDMFINGRFWEDVELMNLLDDLINSMK